MSGFDPLVDRRLKYSISPVAALGVWRRSRHTDYCFGLTARGSAILVSVKLLSLFLWWCWVLLPLLHPDCFASLLLASISHELGRLELDPHTHTRQSIHPPPPPRFGADGTCGPIVHVSPVLLTVSFLYGVTWRYMTLRYITLQMVEDGRCNNDCRFSRDNVCDDRRAMGACPDGTDCQDCGPWGHTNFTQVSSAHVSMAVTATTREMSRICPQ